MIAIEQSQLLSYQQLFSYALLVAMKIVLFILA